jgi:hypothetical protein
MGLEHFLSRIKNRLHRFKNSIAAIPLKLFAKKIVENQWKKKKLEVLPPNHGLPGSLYVNLTSFPPRFQELHLTLKSLLLQTTRPDHIVLWLYEPDIEKLPNSTLELQKYGLLIKGYPTDIRSYKKLIPAIELWPDAFHVTADDDIYYRTDWLNQFVSAYSGNLKEVIALRVHQITKDKDGMILSYSKWTKKVLTNTPSQDLIATGCAGIFYPPRCLHANTANQGLFMELAPNADDIWFYWMAIANHSMIRVIGNNQKLISWKSSKTMNLLALNRSPETGNDAQFNNVRNYIEQMRASD